MTKEHLRADASDPRRQSLSAVTAAKAMDTGGVCYDFVTPRRQNMWPEALEYGQSGTWACWIQD